MQLVSDPARLREARRFVARHALDAGLAPTEVQELAVAFSEVCANVHRHAYRGRRDGRVDLRVAADDDGIVVTVAHEGDPFDPRAYEPPDLSRPGESGYGLYLISRLVDEVSYERTGPEGRVVMVKRRAARVSCTDGPSEGVVMAEKRSKTMREGEASGIVPDLAELCRIHEIGIDLIERSHDVDDLLDRVLEEYEKRLSDLPADALDARSAAPRPESLQKLRALVMFATQASALKEKAVAAGELKRRAAMLERALEEAEHARGRLDGVLAALSSGVMIRASDGTFVRANAAARGLVGENEDPVLTRLIAAGVPENGEAEIDLPTTDGGRRTLLVARRAMAKDTGSEVVLVTDVTQRNHAVEERLRLEKLAEVLKTLSVLSHKINNPLTALLGRAQMLQAKKATDPSVAKAAAVIEESSLRIAELIRELAQVVKDGRQDALDELLDMGVKAAGEGSAS
jgi:serine/threonine-protein kinase RsbW